MVQNADILGEVEENSRKILEEIDDNDFNQILFIDLLNAGVDISNIIKKGS